MKGRTPTADEKRWMDEVAQLGCISCKKLGVHQPEISIHHIRGRTREGAHFETLPLCYLHHQGGDKDGQFISVHPWKRRFEEMFGTQRELLAECQSLVRENKNG